jgi:hypothetical protein
VGLPSTSASLMTTFAGTSRKLASLQASTCFLIHVFTHHYPSLLICHIDLIFPISIVFDIRNPHHALGLAIGRAQPIAAWRLPLKRQ